MGTNYDKVKQLKREILRASYETQNGYLASSFSILDILIVLYNSVMRLNKNNLFDEKNDRCVLSKGHAAFGLYAVLADRGYFEMSELMTFGQFNSRLGLMPDRNKVPGVEFSTGSLGHGFPNAVGLAYACKLNKFNNRIFVIVGDGEMNEGTMWESALIAPQMRLNNLCCIVDNNHSSMPAVDLSDLKTKFMSFGWDAHTVNGHNHAELETALNLISDKPIAIIAKTIKGYGCELMENNPQLWHGKVPNKEEYLTMINNLE